MNSIVTVIVVVLPTIEYKKFSLQIWDSYTRLSPDSRPKKNMEVLKLPRSLYNIQKCLLPSCQFLKEYYGRICLISSSSLDFHCIVRIGMYEAKITNNILYMDDSVRLCSRNKHLIENGDLNKINIRSNLKILKNPLFAKMVEVVVVFSDIVEMEAYKNNQAALARIIKNILKFYIFCNKSMIYLNNIEMHKRFFIKCLIISCAENLSDYQPYEINSRTEIKIKTSISELKFVSSEINNSYIDFGGYHKTSRILEDIMEFSYVNSHKKKLINKLLLTGPQGCGKSSLVRHISCKCKCMLLEIKACEVISLDADKIEAVLQVIFKEAQLYAALNDCCVILIKNIDMVSCSKNFYSKKFTQTLVHLLEDVNMKDRIVVIATANCSANIDSHLKRTGRFEDEVEMTFPNAVEREEILFLMLKKSKSSFNKALLTQLSKWTAGFVGSDIKILVVEALKLHYKEQKNIPGFQSPSKWHVLQECFKRALKKVIPEILKDAINVNREDDLKFSCLGGLENIKSILELEVIKQLQSFEKFYKLGISFTNGILLYGPPGCAKTSLVRALAKECDATFFVTSAADLYSSYVGDTEKKLIKLFSQARMSSPSIVFIDEIDSVIGSKSGERERGIQERILSTLLLEMDGVSSKILAHDRHSLNFLGENNYINKEKNLPGKEINFGVIVVGATNLPHLLDEALMRPGRFDRLVYVPPPNEIERFQILKKLTEKMPLHESVDLESLAKLTNYFTGADLRNLCNESGLYAMQCGGMDVEYIHQFHFVQTIFGLKPSLDEKVVNYYKSFEINKMSC